MELPAVFHLLRAGTLTGQDLFAYVDAALVDTDPQSIDGIMADMGEGLSHEPSPGPDAGGSDVGRAMLRLYTTARSATAGAAGFYNHNVRLDTPAGPVIVRIPIDGALLDATAPRGVPVPETFTDDAAELFDRLGQVPAGDLPPLPRGWAEDGDAPAFARQLSDVTGGVWGRFRRRYGPLYAALGVPPIRSRRSWTAGRR